MQITQLRACCKSLHHHDHHHPHHHHHHYGSVVTSDGVNATDPGGLLRCIRASTDDGTRVACKKVSKQNNTKHSSSFIIIPSNSVLAPSTVNRHTSARGRPRPHHASSAVVRALNLFAFARFVNQSILLFASSFSFAGEP